jgi:hypothetical protein
LQIHAVLLVLRIHFRGLTGRASCAGEDHPDEGYQPEEGRAQEPEKGQGGQTQRGRRQGEEGSEKQERTE